MKMPFFFVTCLTVSLLSLPQLPAQDEKAKDGEKIEKSKKPSGPAPGYSIPIVDISSDKSRQVIVDREKGQYLGHPTTVLLEDNKTMLCVYPKGHGKGGIVYKRSVDAGKTWSERIPVPENWASSREVPTIHRVVDATGKKRLIMFSGLFPCRMAVSEDDGSNWSPLKKIGDWGGIVCMGSVVELRTAPGHYAAFFHDDGRFFKKDGKRTGKFIVYKTLSTDGGLTWGEPEAIVQHPEAHLCEPGVIRSPDGKQLCMLFRENSRKFNGFVIFSNDEGKTWTKPRQLPASLTGDRHIGRYAADGRLFITFRDTTRKSLTSGDWVGWVGTYDDIVKGKEGQYRVRLMDNTKSKDCAYPGLELLPDDTFVTTTYGHWTKGESPYITSVRFKLEELDKKLAKDGELIFDGKSLAGWSSVEFGGEDEVTVKDGVITMKYGHPFTGIKYEGTPPTENYELSLEARRTEGSDFFCGLTVPVGKSHCSLIVGGWGGGLVGISSIDHLDASENETSSYLEVEKNKWYPVRIRVTKIRLEAWINKKSICDINMKDRKITLRAGDIELCAPLGVATYSTTGELRNLKLRRLSDEEVKKINKAAPPASDDF